MELAARAALSGRSLQEYIRAQLITARAGDISEEVAALSVGELLDWRIELFPYEPFADRVWELRPNLISSDEWYVAIAEELGVSLATLDGRLRRTSGPRCTFCQP